MSLTPAQLATLKADILADGTLNAKPDTPDGNIEVAAAYNALAAGPFTVWASTTPTSTVFDAIIWASLTPTDAADGTALWTNRNLMCQSKQMNVQTMLVGRESISSGKANIRAGLQDALTNVPSGASGANLAAGWTAVRDGMKRSATRGEKLFATGGNGAFGTPADLGFEGQLTYSDVHQARIS